MVAPLDLHSFPGSVLRRLLPNEVVWRAGPVDSAHEPLHPQEAPAVARAIPKRQREFSVGRHFARQALQGLCGQTAAIPAGADRAPNWPLGIVGSITHSDVLCAAAVAHASQVTGLGIDVDSISRFDESLTSSLCTPTEVQRWLDDLDLQSRKQRLATLFSFKEAFYKAQYTISRAWLGFHDVEVTRWDVLDDGLCALQLRLLNPPRFRGGAAIPATIEERLMQQAWAGQAAIDGPHVWASVVMRA